MSKRVDILEELIKCLNQKKNDIECGNKDSVQISSFEKELERILLLVNEESKVKERFTYLLILTFDDGKSKPVMTDAEDRVEAIQNVMMYCKRNALYPQMVKCIRIENEFGDIDIA